MDCCAVGFDGRRLLAPPRAISALNARFSVMRSDLLTLNLRRAIKYAARGFGLALPQRRVNLQPECASACTFYCNGPYHACGSVPRSGHTLSLAALASIRDLNVSWRLR